MADSASSTASAPRRRAATLVGIAGVIVAVSLMAGAAPAASIVRGRPVNVAAHPHQVALLDQRGQFCGGAVIGRRTVVTAAHCMSGVQARDLTVQAGSTNLYRGPAQFRSVARIRRHPRYARREVADVAVLVLTEPLRFNRRVQPIELASVEELAAATRATVSGWGDRREGAARGSRTLRLTSIPLIDDAACSVALEEFDAPTEVCAGGLGSDACYGDSGGPLVIRTASGERRLAGIVSWGIPPCGGRAPGVYADVAALSTWIERKSAG